MSGHSDVEIFGCHLRCWWSLFSEYCVRPRVIFYNATSESDPAFLLLTLRFQLRILKMTEIHQWRKMNFLAFIPCFFDHVYLVSDFRQLPYRHRNVQLSTRSFHCELEFFVVWFHEEISSQLSGIIELWFLDSPSLFSFLFRCIGHKFPHIWPDIIRTRGCLFHCKSLPGPCVSFRWPFLQ